MNGIHVDSELMREKGIGTVKSAEDLEAQVNSLKANMDELMTIWKGPAAEGFQTAVNEQVSNLNQFKELLNTLGEKIIDGANRFNETEEANANQASKLFN